MRLELGRVVATPGALEALERAGEGAIGFLARHQRGDWGSVCPEDAEANREAVEHGFRVLSVYETTLGDTIWVITEADRSSTCILLPSEY